MDFLQSLSIGNLRKYPQIPFKFKPGSHAYSSALAIVAVNRINRMAYWLTGDDVMARKKDKIDWTLHNRPLTEKELKAFDTWYEQNIEDIDTHLGNTCLQGFKFSLSFDDRSGSFIATITGKDVEECPNPRTSMSSWDRNFDSALMMCLFKHMVIYSGDVWTVEDLPPKRG